MHVQTWGAFVFIAHEPGSTTLETWLGEGGAALLPRLPSAEAFVHVGRKEYMLQCNWKVRKCHAGMLPMIVTTIAVIASPATSRPGIMLHSVLRCHAGVL